MINRIKEKFKENEPIFIDDIRNVYIEYSRAMVFKIIAKFVKCRELIRFDKGIYYIPSKTEFGISKLNVKKVVEKKYISNDNEEYGFYSGLTLINSIGLTEQVPNIIEIVTNNETTRVREVLVNNQRVRIRRPRTKITKENWRVLQVLELFNTIKLEDYKDKLGTIANYVKKCGVTTKEINCYATYYPAKAIKNYYMSGVSNVFTRG